VPDDKRAQANIPGPDEIGMEGEVALLADKEQPLLGAIPPARVAAAGTTLTGVVGIHTDADAARQSGLVGNDTPEFRKGPVGGVAIGLARFGGHGDQVVALAAPLAAFGPFANVRELFQADQAVRMGVQDLPGDGMVGTQRSPVSSAGCMAMRRRVGGHVPLRWSRFWRRA
jgi:hypothetical protein